MRKALSRPCSWTWLKVVRYRRCLRFCGSGASRTLDGAAGPGISALSPSCPSSARLPGFRCCCPRGSSSSSCPRATCCRGPGGWRFSAASPPAAERKQSVVSFCTDSPKTPPDKTSRLAFGTDPRARKPWKQLARARKPVPTHEEAGSHERGSRGSRSHARRSRGSRSHALASPGSRFHARGSSPGWVRPSVLHPSPRSTKGPSTTPAV